MREGVGKVEALSASSTLGLVKEGVPAVSGLGPSGLPSIMLEAILRRKGRPREAGDGSLLPVLGGRAGEGARNPA